MRLVASNAPEYPLRRSFKDHSLPRLTVLRLLAALAIPATSLYARAALPSPVQDPFDSVRAYVRRMMEERAIPSVAIAAAKGGRILWEEGFGWANKARQIKATAATMYSLASISKPITATGLMVLVERGKIGLDRPAEQYLKGARLTAREGRSADATVRLVANHTAGLPLHYQFFYSGALPARPSMNETIRRYGILVAPPGAQFTYSNLGFGIIDQIVERTSGLPFETFMRREVFQPLGLPRTAIVTAPIAGDTVAERYDGSGAPITWYDFDHRGASAVYSSAHDLARFGMFHLGDRLDGRAVLSPASLAEMHRPTVHRSETVGYGVGWQTFEDDNGAVSLGHSGGMPGVATILRIYPEADAVVVVLLNAGANDVAGRIAARVAAAMLPPQFGETLRQREGRGPDPAPDSFRPNGELVGEWNGTVRTWNGTVPLKLIIDAEGAARATLGDRPSAPVGGLRWQGGRLTGNLTGRLSTPDASRDTTAVFDVRLHESRLSGSVSSTLPNAHALSSYVMLVRRPAP
ncbi:MAG: serine hydrolase domain-containing protein [Gemmatimonadota bacterium]